MIDTDALRQKLLTQAFSGQLVADHLKYGSVEKDYSLIQEKRNSLIKARIIRAEKPLPAISESEIIKPIPKSWKWVRLGEISIINPKNVAEEGTPCSFIPMDLVDGGMANHHSCRDAIWGQVKKGYTHFADGDIGVAKITPCFENKKSVVFSNLENGIGAGTTELSVIRLFCGLCSSEFLLYFFKRDEFIRQGIASFTGAVGQQRVHKDFLKMLPVPMPPYEEQVAIVRRIQELFSLLDQVDRLQQQYANNITSLNKKILDLAVRGKLVPQDPNDEPASVLLKKNAEEKQKLIKEGKIKKQKALPAITEEEIPFDIPESWAWVRLGELCEVVTGRLDANAQDKNGKYPFFTCGEEVYTTKDYAFDCDAIQLGGNNAAGIYKMHRFAGKFNAYQRVYVISGRSKHEMDYIYCVIKFWLPSLRVSSQGTTTRFIKLGQVTEMLVPYPPVNEQKRIVEKLSQAISDLSQMRGKTSKTHPVYYPKGLMEL